jgi:heat shock protein HslJ
VNGDSHLVVVGENTRQTPWIEAGEFLQGDLGCNTMSQGDPTYKVEGNLLHPGQIYTTAGRCEDKLMAVEEAFNALMGNGQVRVEVTDQSMTWTRGDDSMTFAAG